MDSTPPRPTPDTEQEKCPHCGAPERQWTKQNISDTCPLDHDWYCGRCGEFIRASSR